MANATIGLTNPDLYKGMLSNNLREAAAWTAKFVWNGWGLLKSRLDPFPLRNTQ